MKQVIITISMLAIALALVISSIIPVMKHGAGTGETAVSEGQAVAVKIGEILK